MPIKRTASKQRLPPKLQPSQKVAGGGSSMLTLLLLVGVAFAGWVQYGDGPVTPAPPQPGLSPAAAVWPTIAKLQAENYQKAAARLLAGETVVAVNADLLVLNRAAIGAGYAPLDAHFVSVLTGKTPAETAAVYTTTAKEILDAF